MIKYILVEVTTCGYMPMPIRAGLKNIPPPRPTAPAKPPATEEKTSCTKFLPLNSTSYCFAKSNLPDFSLRACSPCTHLICVKAQNEATTRKRHKSDQSGALHFSMSTMDLFFFEPLNILTRKASATINEASKWMRH